MTAITINTANDRKRFRYLEDITVTNGTGMGGDAKTRAVRVPGDAKYAKFYLYIDSAGGTSPLVDFTLGTPDFGDADGEFATPDDTNVGLLGNWDGITQVTGTGPYLITVDVGPDVPDDDSGSATADCRYGVNAVLPRFITYTITIDTTTNDEDYAIRLLVEFR